MPVIEGVGDEVTLVLVFFAIAVVILLAWFSTHTNEVPFIRDVGLIVVEMSQRRNRNSQMTEGGHGNGSTADTEDSLSINLSSSIPQSRAESDHEDSESLASGNMASNEDISENIESPQNDILINSPINRFDDNLEAAGGAESNQSSDIKKVTEPKNVLDSELSGTKNSPNFEVLESSVSTTTETDHPTENQLRQRRLNYFQNPPNESLSVNNVDVNNTKLDDTKNTVDTVSSIKPSGDDSPRQREPLLEEPALPNSSSEATLSGVPPSSPTEVIPQLSPTVAASDSVQEARIRVKLKYMNETQRLVYARPEDTIGDFRRTHFQSELEENKWVRFIFNGQDLRDDARTLQACNVRDNCTVHCLVTSQNRAGPSPDSSSDDEENSFLGSMMYPLFAFILSIVWYFRFTYRQYFSAMSTVCLIGISFLLGLSYISSFRNTETPPPSPPQSDSRSNQSQDQRA